VRSRRSRRRLAPDARKVELLEAAERVLRKRGAAETRVADVARAAGAAKGTFYLYFASWEDLLRELRKRAFSTFDRRLAPALPPADAADWWRLVDALAAGFVDFVLELEGLHEAIFHGAIADERPRDPATDAVARVARFLEAGAAAGAFARLDAEPTARLVFAMLHAAADAIAAGDDRERVLRALHVTLRRVLRRTEGEDG